VPRQRTLFYLLIIPIVLAACTPAPQPPMSDLSAIEEAVERSRATVDLSDHQALFTYDRSLPLNIQEGSTWREGRSVWTDFTYGSPLGGRVPARLGLPGGDGPFPGILLMHGSDGDIEIFTPEARKYVQLGAAVLLIESPHIRPGGRESSNVVSYIWPYMTEQDREDQIQLIVDLQRAVDILVENPKVDADRLAYIGFSYGGAMGGLFAGIETRLKAYVFVVGDGGLVEHLSDPLENGLPGYFNKTWVDLMWPIEPLHYVGQAKPAALLYQNGLQDELVSIGDALRYQTAGSEPKTRLWYDAGHNLGPRAFQDASLWLQKYLGDDLLWMAPDYHTTARWLDRGFTLWLITCVSAIAILFLAQRKAQSSAMTTVIWGLAGAVVGPISLIFYSLCSRTDRTRDKKANRTEDLHQNLLYAVMGSVIYLIGSLLGTLLSTLVFDGDLTVLTYVGAVTLGWLILWVLRNEFFVRPFIWLLSVNILWAINVIASYPLMEFWRLTYLLHPRLLWYIGSLSLLNIALLFVFFLALNRRDYLIYSGGERKGDHGNQSRKITWPLGLALLLMSFLLDILAILYTIADLRGLSVIEWTKDLIGGLF